MIYTVAYPELSLADAEFIAEYRRTHDLAFREVIGAHFTLVFGCSTIPESDYLDHVESVAQASRRIEFCCRYAMLGSDAEEEAAYVFLVPEEGLGAVSLLHDRLYGGLFAPLLRLDIPFTPHISIATSTDRREAKRLCDGLNEKGVSICGAVNLLTAGALEAGRFRDMASFDLTAECCGARAGQPKTIELG